MDRLALIFDKPAEAWNEALPLGNGTMGAMSYGRFQNERIEMEETRKIPTKMSTGIFLENTFLQGITREQRIIAKKMC